MKRFTSARPSPAMVVAMLALFVSLGGVSYAATKLAKNSVGARQIKNKAIGTAKIKNNAVTSTKVRNGTLRTADFQPGVLPVVSDGISGYEQVTAGAPASSETSQNATATCPPGKVVIGGGARIFMGEGKVVLDESYPNSPTTYYAETRAVGEAPAAVNHGLNIVAICADALPAG